MAKIIIKNLKGKTIEANSEKTLLQNILDAKVDWMHACGMKGRCTSCKAIVSEGLENLSLLSEHEVRMNNLNRLGQKERQTCQAKLLQGEVEISIPKNFQLPHIEYSEH